MPAGRTQAEARVVAPPVGHVDAADEADALVDHDLLLMVAEEAVEPRTGVGVCSSTDGEHSWRARAELGIHGFQHRDCIGGVGRHIRRTFPRQHVDFERGVGFGRGQELVVQAHVRLQMNVPIDLPAEHVDRLLGLADSVSQCSEVRLPGQERLDVVSVRVWVWIGFRHPDRIGRMTLVRVTRGRKNLMNRALRAHARVFGLLRHVGFSL